MKITPLLIPALAAASLAAALLLPDQTFGAADTDAAKLATAIREIQTQQAALLANQLKVEEKIAAVAEEVRLARIYVSRGGSAAK